MLRIDQSFRIQLQIFILVPLDRVMPPSPPIDLTVFARMWSFWKELKFVNKINVPRVFTNHENDLIHIHRIF